MRPPQSSTTASARNRVVGAAAIAFAGYCRLDRVAGYDRHPAEANYSTLFAETKLPREKLPESR